MLDIKIIKAKRLGLDVYKVYINKTYACEFLSQRGAQAYIGAKFKGQSVVFKVMRMPEV